MPSLRERIALDVAGRDWLNSMATAHHCRDRQTIATLEGERDAAIAQAAALAEDNAKLRAELDAAREGAAFYMGLYAEGVTR